MIATLYGHGPDWLYRDTEVWWRWNWSGISLPVIRCSCHGNMYTRRVIGSGLSYLEVAYYAER